MAQPVSALAAGDVYRREDDADRLFRILGILVDGAIQPLAFFEVDSRDGSLRTSECEEVIGISSRTRR